MEGPPLMLAPDTAQNLGLAFHELATNASKYGALAADDGRARRHLDAGPTGGSASSGASAAARRSARPSAAASAGCCSSGWSAPPSTARSRSTSSPRAWSARSSSPRTASLPRPQRQSDATDATARLRFRPPRGARAPGRSRRTQPRRAGRVRRSVVRSTRRISPRQVRSPPILSSRLSQGPRAGVSGDGYPANRVTSARSPPFCRRLPGVARPACALSTPRPRRPQAVNRPSARSFPAPRATNVNARVSARVRRSPFPTRSRGDRLHGAPGGMDSRGSAHRPQSVGRRPAHGASPP